MHLQAISSLLPYFTLGLFIVGLFLTRSRIILAPLFAAQLVFAFIQGIINPLGLFAIVAFWGLCTLHWRHLSTKEWYNLIRIFALSLVAIAFASHMVPGFHNLRLFTGILISPSAAPFTMYLNFDKTIAAVVLVMASGLFVRQANPFGIKTLRNTVLISALCIAVLIPLAILSGYVQFDPKFPEVFWFWAFNNLYFVCFAEEVIFRGMIQSHLMTLAHRWKISPFIPIVISAILFAVALPGHRQGGLDFMAFTVVAGLFYGYAYHRTRRLESAILVHFIVNVTHFLFFTYPMLAR